MVTPNKMKETTRPSRAERRRIKNAKTPHYCTKGTVLVAKTTFKEVKKVSKSGKEYTDYEQSFNTFRIDG